MQLTHLQRLEAEAIQIMREVVAKCEKPVMMHSIGKDSTVMLHLARKAFAPVPPLLHARTEAGAGRARLRHRIRRWPARRREVACQGTHLLVPHRDAPLGPEEPAPRTLAPYNGRKRKRKGESIRVFPISNWTGIDIWQYIAQKNIEIVPLYLAAVRRVVERDGMLLMVDDERMPLLDGESSAMRQVRFRTLGRYPLTGAVESDATTLAEVVREVLMARGSELQGRVIDRDDGASMEQKKQNGCF
jgi:sulfate adenylyltransferase subunit 2